MVDDDEPPKDDLLTLAAIGVLAYLSADIAHHALGHALACPLLGGRLQALSSIHVTCTVTGTVIDLAGPAANLLVGLVCLGGGIAIRDRARLQLSLLEAAGFNLLWLFGQLMFDAAARTDDWEQLIRMLHPSETWSFGFIVLGIAGYLATMKVLGAACRGFAASGKGRLRRIMVAAWVAAIVAATLTGARDPGGVRALLQQAVPQALVLPIGLIFLRPAPSVQSAGWVERSAPLAIFALVLLGLSVAYLGPGIGRG